MELTIGAKLIIETLNKSGYEAYAVGGFVRDNLLDIESFDVDITTSATPDKILEIFKDFKVYKTGLKHGTVTINAENENIEVTTFRVDGEYFDNRHPDTVNFVSDLKTDLERRDFTVNAMAFDGENLVDLFGGKEDIKNKIIRAVGDPYKRFSEDALRILRALRFASQLDFEIEKNTANAMREKASLLKSVSIERIFSELSKILVGKGAERVLLSHREVIFEVIPELKLCNGFSQNTKYHAYDVYEHIVHSVGKSYSDKTVRWALLLHDIEKPSCYSVDKFGVGHFYGHQQKSAKKSIEILKRLKADNKLIKDVNDLVFLHDIKTEVERGEIKKMINAYGVELLEKLALVKIADGLAHAEEYTEFRKMLAEKFINTVREIINNGECYSLKQLKVNGNDLKKLGYQGAEIKEKLQEILTEVIFDRLENDRELILKRL
ncbi:MAG: CCA tRNA nucleotidyltransferase [Clostridiales bacterium]|nr:CCA tRNA nucleotidyltransferase [Clostridiales bacterium]